MIFTGVHLLAVIVAVVAIYLALHYVEWRRADRTRRSDRLVHRNLTRMGGQS